MTAAIGDSTRAEGFAGSRLVAVRFCAQRAEGLIELVHFTSLLPHAAAASSGVCSRVRTVGFGTPITSAVRPKKVFDLAQHDGCAMVEGERVERNAQPVGELTTLAVGIGQRLGLGYAHQMKALEPGPAPHRCAQVAAHVEHRDAEQIRAYGAFAAVVPEGGGRRHEDLVQHVLHVGRLRDEPPYQRAHGSVMLAIETRQRGTVASLQRLEPPLVRFRPSPVWRDHLGVPAAGARPCSVTSGRLGWMRMLIRQYLHAEGRAWPHRNDGTRAALALIAVVGRPFVVRGGPEQRVERGARIEGQLVDHVEGGHDARLRERAQVAVAKRGGEIGERVEVHVEPLGRSGVSADANAATGSGR